MRSYAATPDIDVLTTNFPIPGFGQVPINAFVLHGREPLLVDTGPVVEADEFLQTLRTVIDPMDLEWIWLTPTDFDHIDTLHHLLDENPRLRVITTVLGVGIMSTADPLPMDRVHLLNPGQRLTLGPVDPRGRPRHVRAGAGDDPRHVSRCRRQVASGPARDDHRHPGLVPEE